MNKILNLFDYNLKLKIIFLIIFMTIASFVELLGLGFIILILNSFLGMESSFFESVINYINNFFQSDITPEQIIFFIFILFTFKLLLLVFVSWMESDFIANFREKISNKLFYNFLNREVKNLLNKNSAEYIRNFTEEIQTSSVFMTGALRIILDTILILSFLIFLLYFNPIITSIVYIFFLTLGFIYYKIVKNKLSTWALISLQNRKKKIQFVAESFSSIKSIKILSRENFFLNKFKKQIKSISNIQFKVNFLAELPRNIFEYILFISILFFFFYLLENQYSNESIIQLLSIYTLVAFRIVPIMNRFLGHMQRVKHSIPSMRKIIIENQKKIIQKKRNEVC